VPTCSGFLTPRGSRTRPADPPHLLIHREVDCRGWAVTPNKYVNPPGGDREPFHAHLGPIFWATTTSPMRSCATRSGYRMNRNPVPNLWWSVLLLEKPSCPMPPSDSTNRCLRQSALVVAQGRCGQLDADQGPFSEAGFETDGGSRTVRATRKHSSAWGTPQ
jgi:hypothetical protein